MLKPLSVFSLGRNLVFHATNVFFAATFFGAKSSQFLIFFCQSDFAFVNRVSCRFPTLHLVIDPAHMLVRRHHMNCLRPRVGAFAIGQVVLDKQTKFQNLWPNIFQLRRKDSLFVDGSVLWGTGEQEFFTANRIGACGSRTPRPFQPNLFDAKVIVAIEIETQRLGFQQHSLFNALKGDRRSLVFGRVDRQFDWLAWLKLMDISPVDGVLLRSVYHQRTGGNILTVCLNRLAV